MGATKEFCKTWTSLARCPHGRGVEVPASRLKGRSETQRARPARLNDYTAKVWTSLAERRAGRGKRRPRVRKGEAEPKTPRRAEADFFSLCRWLRRGETPNGNEPTTFHSRHRPPEKKNRNHHIDRAQEKERCAEAKRRVARGEAEPRSGRKRPRASRRERGKTVKRENHLTTTNDARRPSGGRIAGECPLGAGK